MREVISLENPAFEWCNVNVVGTSTLGNIDGVLKEGNINFGMTSGVTITTTKLEYTPFFEP